MYSLQKAWNRALAYWKVHRELILLFATLFFLLLLIVVVAGATLKNRTSIPKSRPNLPASQNLTLGEVENRESDVFGLDIKAINPQMTFIEKQAIYQHAQKLYQLGATAQAAEQYGVLVEVFSTDARLFNDYGNALRDLGKVDEAEKMYRRSFELEPHMLPAYTNLAGMLLDAGRYDVSKRVIEDGKRANSDSEIYDAAVQPLIELLNHYTSADDAS